MPVLVTNADHSPHLDIALAIAELGGEVRAYVGGDGDVAALRQAGIFVSVGTPDDEGRLESAMEQVHTVIHLEDPTVATSAELWTSRAAVVLRAATGARVARLIARSVPGASLASQDPLHAASGAWEQALADAPLPTVVLRLALVDTADVVDALLSASTPDMLAAMVAPVGAADLVAAVVALDDVRSTATTGHAVLDAEGQVRDTLAGHLGRIAPGGIVGRRYVPRAEVPMLPFAVLGDAGSGQESTNLWAFTEIEPTS